MNIKAYFLASLVAPSIGLVLIIVAIISDLYTGNISFSEELNNGGFAHLFLGYIIFVSICFIATFFIALFSTLFIGISIRNSKVFLMVGAVVGIVVAILSLFYMASGNLSQENGLYSFSFGLVGLLLGLLTAKAYSKVVKNSFTTFL